MVRELIKNSPPFLSQDTLRYTSAASVFKELKCQKLIPDSYDNVAKGKGDFFEGHCAGNHLVVLFAGAGFHFAATISFAPSVAHNIIKMRIIRHIFHKVFL